MRTATIFAAGAFAVALAASVFLSLVNSVSSETCVADASGVNNCTSSSSTILEDQGTTVLAYFVVQLALTGAGFLASLQSFAAPMAVRWAIAGGLTVLCLAAGFSVGLFFLPGALLLLVSTFIDQREAAHE